jgi:hypothetical protein
LPIETPAEHGVEVDFLIAAAKYAQISGRMLKKMRRLRKSSPTFQEMVDFTSELTQDLEDWYSSIPSGIKINKIDLDTVVLPTATNVNKALFLYNAYQATLIVLHSVLVRPWNLLPGFSGGHERGRVRKNVLHSTKIVAEAARHMVRCLPHVTVDPSSPKS